MNIDSQPCKSKKDISKDNHLQSLVKDYIQWYGDSYNIEDQWWGDKTLTWTEAIERAWKSRFQDGKMHSHQYRVSNKLPEGLKVALDDKVQPESFEDFQALHNWVQSIVGRVRGLGATTAYDVARRLGVWLEIEPIVVYLHAGTAFGARKFGVKTDTAPLSAFPQEIQVLGATHAENFLCIYKEQIFPQSLHSTPKGYCIGN
ncbi:MAG: hypothetical protein PUP93_15980 [Rhizonema sp. NSF051]|nr:hypothetical protein [Rhizonema sp. NSF051]